MTKLPNKVSYHSSSPSSFFLINNKRGCKLRTHSGFQKDWYVNHRGAVYPTRIQTRKGGGGGGKLLPNILLNEINILTTCKVIIKGLVSRLTEVCNDHVHHVINQRSMVLRRYKNMAVEGGAVSHHYILVICQFIDFMSFFRHSVWFCFFF